MALPELIDLEKTPHAVTYDASGYDLDGYRRALEEIGSPHCGQSFIHVAGTKGKGSTVAIAESLLLAAGVNTATFTSPHLIHYGERFRFNGQPWSESEFDVASKRLVAEFGPRAYRTAFEFLTSLALVEFGRRGKELQRKDASPRASQVICWETGLGGRLDCTNVVTPLISVITAIGLDHTQILGDSIEAIASEKCGIMKQGIPVVISRQSERFRERVLKVVKERAAALSCPLIYAYDLARVSNRRALPNGQKVRISLPLGDIDAVVSLRGEFQCSNVEAAIAAIWYVTTEMGLPLSAEVIQLGLSSVRWPGRMEAFVGPGGQTVTLDGAHCPLSAEALVQTVVEDALVRFPFHILWAMQRDKNHAEFMRRCIEKSGHGAIECVHTYPTGGERGADPSALARVADDCGVLSSAYESAQEALQVAIRSGRDILAIGSLSTIATVRSSLEVMWPDQFAPLE